MLFFLFFHHLQRKVILPEFMDVPFQQYDPIHEISFQIFFYKGPSWSY